VTWVLYSRRGCHLCEAAEDIVVAHRSDVVVIDVDRDAQARARFDLRVPVLEIDGAVVVEGRFDEATIARLAAGQGSDA
jgi:glutaredoxin